MPMFIFDGNFNPADKRILEKSAKNHCTELGIRDKDCTVTIRKEMIGETSTKAQMTQLENGQFLIMLNKNGYNLYEAISSLGHELVHVRQYLQGHLKNAPIGTSWKGMHIPAIICDLCYKDLPWEVEAFDLQPRLHWQALEKLGTREKFAVAMSAALAKEAFVAELLRETDS